MYFQIYEKALDEPKYSSLYAQLCLRFSEHAPNFDDPGKAGHCVSMTPLLYFSRTFLSKHTVHTVQLVCYKNISRGLIEKS